MFKRKIKLVLTNEEYRYFVAVLVETRNKLLAENKYTDAVDKMLFKLCK